MARTSLSFSKTRLVMNGAKLPPPSIVPKIPNGLIFSGAMDFAPNYEAALWFLDEAFPLVLREHPNAHIVIAGMNPVPRLMQRACKQVRITGFVQDMGGEIACSGLYFSALISGRGFKNKIVEAILNGTYVIGTPMSFEFLEPRVRRLLTVTSNAAGMSRAVNNFLRDPCEFDARLREVQRLLARSCTWPARAADLLGVVADAHSQYFKESRLPETRRDTVAMAS